MLDDKIIEFLEQSNYIEQEYSEIALDDAITAWEYAFKNIDGIGVEEILTIHKYLLHRVNPRIAGKIRDCDVFIGGKRKAFIGEAVIQGDLQMKVCFEMLVKGMTNKGAWARQIHVAFEHIHPFEDGNGRVGRILWQIHRLRLGLPIKIIHEGEEQKEYYKWFK